MPCFLYCENLFFTLQKEHKLKVPEKIVREMCKEEFPHIYASHIIFRGIK